jgi:hypothetical protein
MRCARCVRCGRELPRGDATGRWVRLAVMVGLAPQPVQWDLRGPWASVDVCQRCARAVALTIATSPLHASGGLPPVELDQVEAIERMAAG